jgi:hypothetical protein
MLNPWFWLEPFFQTPKDTMAEAEADKQKHAEAMINPVPKMDDPPHNRAQALRKVLFDWRHDNILDLEVNNLELEDLYDRLHAHWVDMKIDAERQAFEANQEKASCGR